VAPAGTSKAVISLLNAEVLKTLNSPELRNRLTAEGANPVGNSPEEFGAFIKSELSMWSKAVRQSGTQLD
jgi:tripartite-type tricarboxylate transporter receptor subunit TctC